MDKAMAPQQQETWDLSTEILFAVEALEKGRAMTSPPPLAVQEPRIRAIREKIVALRTLMEQSWRNS